MDIRALQQYVWKEIKSRNISMRQFAELLGVNSSTLSRFLDERDPTTPTFELIEKLANVAEDQKAFIALLFPNATGEVETSASAQWVAQNFDHLSDDLKGAILAIIRYANNSNSSPEKAPP